MRKKTKKYFVGGAVNSGMVAGSNAIGLDGNTGNVLGSSAQALTGLASGDMQDSVQGLTGLLSSGATNAGTIFNDPNSSFKDKLVGAYGAVNPLASSGIADKIQQRQAGENEFNNLISNNNIMEDGGSLLEFGGYSHEDQDPNNVNGGNLIKGDGENNHVTEKGETLKDGYVYSDSLLVQEGKSAGKTFAEASKKIDKLYSERPNDKIFKHAKERDLNLLADQNDSARQQQEATDEMNLRCGGKMYYKGGKIQEGDFDVEDLSIDEIDYLNKQGYDIEIL